MAGSPKSSDYSRGPHVFEQTCAQRSLCVHKSRYMPKLGVCATSLLFPPGSDHGCICLQKIVMEQPKKTNTPRITKPPKTRTVRSYDSYLLYGNWDYQHPLNSRLHSCKSCPLDAGDSEAEAPRIHSGAVQTVPVWIAAPMKLQELKLKPPNP